MADHSKLSCLRATSRRRERSGVDVRASSGLLDVLLSALALTALLFPATARAAPASGAVAPPSKDAPAADEDADDDDDDSDVAFGAEADFDARYLWRGLALSSGAVVQPSAWATVYGFNAVVATNVMLTNEAPKRLSAIVPAVTYTYEWKALTIEPGFLVYDTPGQPIPPTTAEASLEASIALGRFRVLTTDYVDVMHAPGAYFGTLGGAWEPRVGRWTFKGLAQLGWATAPYNQVYFDTRGAALDVAEVGASAQLALTDVLYVTLHAEGSTLLSSALAAGRERTLGNIGLAFGGELGL